MTERQAFVAAKRAWAEQVWEAHQRMRIADEASWRLEWLGEGRKVEERGESEQEEGEGGGGKSLPGSEKS